MSVMSSILSRFGLAGLAGIQFGGKRDLYAIFGYKSRLTYSDYYAKYRRQDVAKRIVNAPASATWRNPATLEGPDAFVKEWKKLSEEHQIWSHIERADRLAGIGYYSILLLGFDDTSDLAKPVTKNEGTKLLYVQPYNQAQATIKEVESDPRSERFGMPKMYELKLEDPLNILQTLNGMEMAKTVTTGKTVKVHYSRVVHIAEELVENNFLGTPRLECVYNLLDDLLKVSGGTAETYWMTSNRGMQLDVDKDAELTPEDAAALSDEAEEYQHELRRIIRTKGVKVTNLGGNTPDPKNTFSMLISLISGATGIPQRILTGSEAGQLASDQDRANWSDRIKERRTMFAEPNVLNPFLTALMNAGVLPEVSLTDISYSWPLNFQLTPLEDAQSMAQRARAIINLSKSFTDGTPICSEEEAREIVGLPATPKVGKIPPPVPEATKKEKTDNQPNDFQAKE